MVIWRLDDKLRKLKEIFQVRKSFFFFAKSDTLFIKDGARQPNSSKTQARSVEVVQNNIRNEPVGELNIE